MLDYKLCKELKEAGFPLEMQSHQYKDNGSGLGVCERCQAILTVPEQTQECLAAPILSELIEQCAKYPFILQLDRYGGVYSGGEWIVINDFDAYLDGGYDGGDLECGDFWCKFSQGVASGDTPEEAVARLCLKLNLK